MGHYKLFDKISAPSTTGIFNKILITCFQSLDEQVVYTFKVTILRYSQDQGNGEIPVECVEKESDDSLPFPSE